MKKGLASRAAATSRDRSPLRPVALGAGHARRAAEVEVKVGLYSITYLGVWYRGGA